MKTKRILFLLTFFLFGTYMANGQGFIPPSQGKAVVYFVRVSGYGAVISFEFFHQDKYIGIFKGKNYLRYECLPGKNLFWVSSENKEFLTSDLQEGGTYIVIVDVTPGFVKGRVGLSPISVKDIEEFDRAKKIIISKAEVITPESKVKEMNTRLADFIKEKLFQYENEWKSTKNFRNISPDMAIPVDAMK